MAQGKRSGCDPRARGEVQQLLDEAMRSVGGIRDVPQHAGQARTSDEPL